MSAEHNATSEQFAVRITELRSQRNLLVLRTQQLSTQEETELVNVCTDIGKVSTDLAWSEAMINLVESGDLDFEIACKIWGAKDEVSRKLKDTS